MQFIDLNHKLNLHLFFMAYIKKIDKFEMKIERVDLIFFFKSSRKRDGEELYILDLFIFILF